MTLKPCGWEIQQTSFCILWKSYENHLKLSPNQTVRARIAQHSSRSHHERCLYQRFQKIRKIFSLKTFLFERKSIGSIFWSDSRPFSTSIACYQVYLRTKVWAWFLSILFTPWVLVSSMLWYPWSSRHATSQSIETYQDNSRIASKS